MYLGSQQLNTTNTYYHNQWYYVAITVDSGNEAKIYVDGRLDNTLGSLSTFGNNLSKDLTIGHTGLGFSGLIDDISVHSGRILTLQEVQDRYAGRKDLRTFSNDINGAPLYTQKYTTPVSKLQFADSVSNVLSYGISADWKVDERTGAGYVSSYTGNVPHVKFYHGDGRPETLVGYASNPQWKVNYTGYFKPPVDSDYVFFIAGSGFISYSIDNESTTVVDTDIEKSLDDQTYSSARVTLLASSSYAFDFGYEYKKGEESGFIVLWQSDSASVSPEKIVLSGGVCNPDSNTVPELIDLDYYSKVAYSIDENGVSTLKFEVPFLKTNEEYGDRGFAYDTSNGYYYDINNSNIKLQEYKMVKYSEGYRNQNNEDELVDKFTGQIRKVEVQYNKTGDKLSVTCNDFSIFTRDAVNKQSPTPIDYWQAGYLTHFPGRANGQTKPRAFDGWAAHKAYQVLLAESNIDSYSMFQKKEHLSFNGFATSGGFLVEPVNSSVQSFFPTSTKYGIDPIGEVGGSNEDDQYAYKVDLGEFYQDSINEFFKSWYYKWGINRQGNPYLKRIQVPSSFQNSEGLNYNVGGSWAKGLDVNAFKGTYKHTNVERIDSGYTLHDIAGLLDIQSTAPLVERIGTILSNPSEANTGNLRGTYHLITSDQYTGRVSVKVYCTSDASAIINATTWPLLSTNNFPSLRAARKFITHFEDVAFNRAKSIGVETTVTLEEITRQTYSLSYLPTHLYYNEVDATGYTDGDIVTTTVTGKKFGLLVGRGPATGAADTASQGTFKYTLHKEGVVLVTSSANPYDTQNKFYYDEPNSSGQNKSYVSIANGLPYDTYQLEIESLDDAYQTRIEGILEFEDDYEVPSVTLHTDDSEKQGSITKLKSDKDTKNHRNDVVVLGRRTGTIYQIDSDGKEVVVNPNNAVDTYIQSSVKDLESIYNIAASNYVGRSKSTIIVDPSILNESQANFIALNFIQEYGNPSKNANMSILGNPLIEPHDCIVVKENVKYGIDETNYLWVKSVNSSIGDVYKTDIQTTPIEPIDSFWDRPAIDLSEYNGNHIYNLHVKNRGMRSTLSADFSDTADHLHVVRHLTSTAAVAAIPIMGYLRIGPELIKYETRSTPDSRVRFGSLTRGLGEFGETLDHFSTDIVAIGFNPYSFAQAPPVVSFNLLTGAKVAVHINYFKDTETSYENSGLLSEIKLDALTSIDSDLEQFNYQYLPAGYYEFAWGGFDRRGQYNNAISPYDYELLESQLYANENYELPYKKGVIGAIYSPTETLTYSTGYGLYFSNIFVIPDGEENSYNYNTLGLDTAYLEDSSGVSGAITQVLNDPGIIDLVIDTAGMRCIEPSGEVAIKSGAWVERTLYTYYSFEATNRNPQNFSPLVYATNFPSCTRDTFTTYSDVPTFIPNKANPDENGSYQGFKWRLEDHSVAKDSDINRYYLPSLSFQIVQMAMTYLATYSTDGQNRNKFYKETTEGNISEFINVPLRLGKDYYFNINRVLREQSPAKEFIPANAKEKFLQYNSLANNPNSAMYVSNYTIFNESMFDMSGRRPKQRRKIVSYPEKSVVHYFNKDEFGGSSRLLEINKPFYFTGDTSNRGMYEWAGGVEHTYWSYDHETSNEDKDIRVDLGFDKHAASEYLSLVGFLQGVADEEGVGNLHNQYYQYIGRDNFVTWMDESTVKEITHFDYARWANNGLPDMILTAVMDENYLINPVGWARYKRSDFGNV